MPYKISWEPAGVLRQYFGDVTIAERRASFDDICADARFDELRYTITDYTAVQGYEATPEATREIAAMHVAPLLTNPHLVIAAVAARPDLLAQLHSFASHGFLTVPYRICASMEEAREWIKAQRRRPLR